MVAYVSLARKKADLWSHGVPELILLFVPPDVVGLRAGIQDAQVDSTDGNKSPISPAV